MNIAEVVSTFPPYLAGTGNVCYHNSIELAKLGHDVTVFTSRFPDEDFNYPNIINVNRFKPLIRIGNAPLMPELFKIKDFDVVHLHYPFFFGGEIIFLISKIRKQKYIITYHQDVIFEGITNIFPKIHMYTLARSIINNATKICVTSFDHAENSFLNRITKRDSFVEIPNGVDIQRFNPDINGNSIKKKYLIDNEKIILFVGALDRAHYFKGVEFLIESFARLRNNTAKLIIVGDGDLKRNYELLSKKLGTNNRTIFAGKVSEEDLPKYYSTSDLLVLPSISEGEIFGIVLIEAMSTGKPVICTNLAGVRTVVDNGINGLVAEPKNILDLTKKIDYILDNDEIARKFGLNGRKKVEKNYSWNNIGKKLEDVFKDI